MISLAGGALGALLLLATPAALLRPAGSLAGRFRHGDVRLGSFFRKPDTGEAAPARPGTTAAMQFVIAVYGGYFGGGIGFLMLAALTMAGLAVRMAGATKNVLAGVMNASAVAIFVFSSYVHWLKAIVFGIGASLGGWAGAFMLKSINESLPLKLLSPSRFAHAIGLFWRA